MKSEYVPSCRGTIAASSDGRDYYRFCVAKFTTLDDVTPQATGKAEVAHFAVKWTRLSRS